jgi:hypothetical protein
VSFAAVTLCVASQRVFIVAVVYFVMTQSGNFWIHPHTCMSKIITHVNENSFVGVPCCRVWSVFTLSHETISCTRSAPVYIPLERMQNLKGRVHSEDLGVDGKIMLEWLLRNGRAWTGCIWLRIGTSGGFL